MDEDLRQEQEGWQTATSGTKRNRNNNNNERQFQQERTFINENYQGRPQQQRQSQTRPTSQPHPQQQNSSSVRPPQQLETNELRVNVTNAALNYARDYHYPPFKLECQQKLTDKKIGLKMIKELTLYIQKDYKAQNPGSSEILFES
ncbi:unnamed protein product, partial [Didymodactylos carnosus]